MLNLDLMVIKKLNVVALMEIHFFKSSQILIETCFEMKYFYNAGTSCFKNI